MRHPHDSPFDAAFTVADPNGVTDPRSRATEADGARHRVVLALKLHGLHEGPGVPTRSFFHHVKVEVHER